MGICQCLESWKTANSIFWLSIVVDGPLCPSSDRNRKLAAMKRIFVILIVLLIAMSVNAQGVVGNMIKYYGHDDGFYSMSVGRGLLWFAKWASADADEASLALSKIRRIRLLVAENGPGNLSKDFSEALKADGFSSVLELTDDGDVIGCYVRNGRNGVGRIVLNVKSTDGEQVIVLLSGCFTMDDVLAICSENVDFKDV